MWSWAAVQGAVAVVGALEALLERDERLSPHRHQLVLHSVDDEARLVRVGEPLVLVPRLAAGEVARAQLVAAEDGGPLVRAAGEELAVLPRVAGAALLEGSEGAVERVQRRGVVGHEGL